MAELIPNLYWSAGFGVTVVDDHAIAVTSPSIPAGYDLESITGPAPEWSEFDPYLNNKPVFIIPKNGEGQGANLEVAPSKPSVGVGTLYMVFRYAAILSVNYEMDLIVTQLFGVRLFNGNLQIALRNSPGYFNSTISIPIRREISETPTTVNPNTAYVLKATASDVGVAGFRRVRVSIRQLTSYFELFSLEGDLAYVAGNQTLRLGFYDRYYYSPIRIARVVQYPTVLTDLEHSKVNADIISEYVYVPPVVDPPTPPEPPPEPTPPPDEELPPPPPLPEVISNLPFEFSSAGPWLDNVPVT